ncbi:membrane protein insertase YidC [Glaciecola sp. XM2]|jgi:YidC/Oxa1 family membrane protein insertase|uniref:membrane protein insertase YidC n=1 Tax=Glaciecola sp. XM2 TaxID=1914931 RepID=UPI001BDE13D1|nr:membrane protein insertase YidC [Glaciecola sp. XM2]MBT1451586.1 membrane protein insertase YidC [Glaciecola sp. XM2]
MESQRSILIIGLLLVSFLLWIEYQEAYGPQVVEPVSNASTTQTLDNQINNSIPSANLTTNTASALDVPTDLSENAPVPAPVQVQSNRFVNVITDTLNVSIDLIGGDVVQADLVQYPVTQGADDSYQLLSPQDATLYVAQSGLIGTDGPDGSGGRPQYTATADTFMMNGTETLQIPIVWQSPEGLSVTKTFEFESNSHTVYVTYTIENNTGRTLQMQQFAQLKQTLNEQSGGSMFMPTFRGAAYSTQDERYEKLPFGDIEDESLRIATIGGWVGMLEHYFVSAWVPPQDQTNTIYSRIVQNNAIVGYTGEGIVVNDAQTSQVTSILYMGPKDQAVLAELARGLDLTVDYGILWWIAQPLFELLKLIQSFVINWGLAIVIITLIVKGAMYWLTKKQYESMAKMRNLAPKMQQLKDRYGDDRQKMSQAMMEMYKKEKVNPMGGCFPLLLQMPIFLALYWVLLESVELRHASFVLWITDLSVPDPFFVLPILTGLSMFLLQKLQPMTIQDPLQQKLLQYMPVAMSVFFFFFPAGLVLYWLISNLVTLAQAKIIYASMEKRGIKSK